MESHRSSLTINVLRWGFDRGAKKASEALTTFVPNDVDAFTDVIYDKDDSDGKLDIFVPRQPVKPLPVIAWLHGGGWFTGRKSDVTNYLKILASKGFVTIGVEYTPAPKAIYPTPVRQTASALVFIQENGAEYGIDTSSIFLAGDSSGAQIAAQTALIITDSTYASKIDIRRPINASCLRGMILYCGAYDLALINNDKRFTWLTRKILSAYFGRSDFENIDNYALASVATNITAAFPATFISAGNGDPLAPFSYGFADQLEQLKVEVDRLFFSPSSRPKVPHEYQFDLDLDAGQTSVRRLIEFVNTHRLS